MEHHRDVDDPTAPVRVLRPIGDERIETALTGLAEFSLSLGIAIEILLHGLLHATLLLGLCAQGKAQGHCKKGKDSLHVVGLVND
jgi:hypothetical protein